MTNASNQLHACAEFQAVTINSPNWPWGDPLNIPGKIPHG